MATSGTFTSGILIGDTGAQGATPQPTLINGAQVSAALEIQSTSGGLVLPRMTQAQIAALPALGTANMIFNTSTNAAVISSANGVANLGIAVSTIVFTGADAIRAAASTASSGLSNVPLSGTTAVGFVFGATLTMGGTRFTAFPLDFTMQIQTNSAEAGGFLIFLTLENRGILTGAVNPPNAPSTNLVPVVAPVGNIDIGNLLILRFTTANPAGLTGGDETTTMTITTYYMQQ